MICVREKKERVIDKLTIMKKIQMMICSVALLGLCTLTQAQDRDTTSTNYSQPPTEQGDTKSDDKKTNDAERPAQTTDQQLQEDADAMQQNFEGSTIDKVGPNGEKLFMQKGKYYYINEKGDKVKVKKSEVRDLSQKP